MEDEPEAVAAVISGDLSATEFLFQYCDGKLNDAMLSDEGNAFAQQYYGEDGLFYLDFALCFPGSLYVVPEAAHDFKKYSALLDARLKSGEFTNEAMKGKPT